jgi:type III pantothenate kinase
MKNNNLKNLLAVDVGNTSVTFGIFSGKKIDVFMVNSSLDGLAGIKKHINRPGMFKKILVSSVVPAINKPLAAALKKATGVVSHFITLKDTGIKARLKDPGEVGMDRLVNTLAAHKIYGKAAIVVDMGTATTFDIVSFQGEYLGGAIAPGIGISSQALWTRCAKLGPVRVSAPLKASGKNTKEAMMSGIVFGHAAMIEGMVSRIKKEHSFKPVIIGTGGFVNIMKKATKIFNITDRYLTLKGIRIIADKVQL